MSEIFIREAKLEDVPVINQIKNYYIINTDYSLAYEPDGTEHTKEWFELYSKKFPILVAEWEGAVVGWGSLTTFRTVAGYDKSPELSVYVREDCKRQGIGGKIMDRLEEEGRRRGFHCIVSVITGNNLPSIEMHLKRGYETDGALREVGYKNGKYLEVIFMTKIIG